MLEVLHLEFSLLIVLNNQLFEYAFQFLEQYYRERASLSLFGGLQLLQRHSFVEVECLRRKNRTPSRILLGSNRALRAIRLDRKQLVLGTIELSDKTHLCDPV